jgi:hypothetical protein
MKIKLHHLFIALLLLAGVNRAAAQGTAFTYQGQLQNNGSPASGTYNLMFSLFNTNTTGVAVAGPVMTNGVVVTNGLFTVQIDFGSGPFTGQTNWLEIAVETNGFSPFTTLAPRQQLTPVPYAIYAESASNLSGTVSASQLTSIGNNNGGSGNYFVGSSGRAATTGSDNTANGAGALAANTSGSDNTANGQDALNFNTSGSENTASGWGAMYVNTTGSHNTAYGAYALPQNQSGSYNTAVGEQALYQNTTASYNTAVGYWALYQSTTGSNNVAVGYDALYSNTVGSNNVANGVGALQFDWNGKNNTAIGYDALWKLGYIQSVGGTNNIALGYQAGYNYMQNESSNIDIGNPGVLGENNTIHIGGGQSQTFIAGVITNTSTLTMQAGVDMDLTSANNVNVTAGAFMDLNSLASMTVESGTLTTIKSDSEIDLKAGATLVVSGALLDFQDPAVMEDMLTVEGLAQLGSVTVGGNMDISGNVGIGAVSPQYLLVVGNSASPAYCDGTTWQNGSDRNSKEDFTAINPRDVLEKVSALPITEWKYKVEADGTEHLGPMAQDFHAAFGLNGPDDKHIATVDEEGVALAAIQGLNQKVEDQLKEKDDELHALKQQNDSLAGRLNELEVTVKQLAQK